MKLNSLVLLSITIAFGVQGADITVAPRAEETENPYTKFPSVEKTASINGFADKIYDRMPECAKPCLLQDTGSTPCPYWDTGCLCVMPQFGGPIGNCIAGGCKGQEVVTATSLAYSICSSAGVWEPYWMIPASVIESLDAAATEEPIVKTTPVETTPVETSPAETTNPGVTNPPTSEETENPYTKFPSVEKTASINGFADKIYDRMPECAKPCLLQDTGSTPCPYWDTGCLCVMPQFGGPIGNCIAGGCKGQEVVTATSLAYSICSSAGVWEPYWMIPASVIESLDAAATEQPETTTDPQVTTDPEATTEGETTQPIETGETVEETQTTDVEQPTVDPSSEASETKEEPTEGPSSKTTGVESEIESEIERETETETGTETQSKAITKSTGGHWNSTSTEIIFKTTTKVIEDCDTNVPCITSIISSCEEEIKALESVQSSASEAKKTEIITSCEAAKSSLSSVQSAAKETLEHLTKAPVETESPVVVTGKASGKYVGFTAIIGVFMFFSLAALV